jgi:hypothetical protein
MAAVSFFSGHHTCSVCAGSRVEKAAATQKSGAQGFRSRSGLTFPPDHCPQHPERVGSNSGGNHQEFEDIELRSPSSLLRDERLVFPRQP